MDPLTARKDALGKKRLDRSLHHILSVLGVDGARSLNGRHCIEFGAGYVPMDAISLWLLGAESVTAVDYNDIASLRALRLGLRKADISSVRSQLTEVAPRCDWHSRLTALEAIGASAGATSDFGQIPFRYIAPLDVIKEPRNLPTFDFLWSTSVLEHIAPSSLVPLLRALKSRASTGAIHMHRVDLRDHRDFDNAPYSFLAPDEYFDPERDADARGNGMTMAAWECLLQDNGDLGLRVTDAQPGRPGLVPRRSSNGEPIVERIADFITVTNFGPDTSQIKEWIEAPHNPT